MGPGVDPLPTWKRQIKHPRVGNVSVCHRTFDGVAACQTHRAMSFDHFLNAPFLKITPERSKYGKDRKISSKDLSVEIPLKAR